MSPSLCWFERPGQVVLRLAAAELPDARPVGLDLGVSELVGTLPLAHTNGKDSPAPWQTCCLEFDCAAGWNRAGAQRWVEQRLKLRHLGRTALLCTPHRMQPGLAQWVSAVGLAGAYWCGRQEPGQLPAVDFVVVPGTAATETRRHGEAESRRRGGGTAAVAVRPRRDRGAGLEVDLGDPRRIDALPVDIRPLLPAQGLVNFLEGQAVVRAIEALLADPTFVAEAARWQQCNARSGWPGRHPALAVMALYPAQVELIRRLIRRLPHLAAPRWASSWACRGPFASASVTPPCSA